MLLLLLTIVVLLSHINSSCQKSRVRGHTKKGAGALGRSEKPNEMKIRPGNTTSKLSHLKRTIRRRRTNEMIQGANWPRASAQHYSYIYFFFTHMDFPASGQAVVAGRCLPFSPPALAFNFFIAHRVQQFHCSSIFHRLFVNSRSCAFRKSICAQEKVPTNLYEYAPGGIRTHETNLYQARG